ncbi:alpha,alpha-trehalose-phosphate synthase (UDP-forming), partial [Natronobacterium gregoryi]
PADATVAQFWHVPWPAPSTFQHCPAGGRILEGLLGNDLLGFHVDQYADRFLDCVNRFLPAATVDKNRRTVRDGGERTRVVATPMGIDAETHARDAESADEEMFDALCSEHGLPDLDETVIGLGVDRLDYTKGIPERLAALERFFERHPDWRGEFTFVQKATPSRTEIPAYERHGELVRSEVERINSRFESGGWQPVVYTDEYLEEAELCSLYRNADVMIVSPLVDGMNLVAQEFVAASVDDAGDVLLLSDRVGAHELLGSHAVSIDPTDVDDFADRIAHALAMPAYERRRRLDVLRERVFDADLDRWMQTQFDWIRRVHQDPRSRGPDVDPDSSERTRPV